MRFTLSDADVAPQDGFAYWREQVCRSFAPLTIDREGEQPFQAKLDVQQQGDIAMMDVFGAGYRMTRSDRDIAAGSADFYLIFQVMERRIDVTANGVNYAVRAGDVGIGDPNIAWTMGVPDGSYRTRNFLVPRALVDPWLAPGQSLRRLHLPAQPGLNGLIGDYVGGLGRNLSQMTAPQSTLALQNLGRLIALATGFHPDQSEAGRAALRAAKFQQAVQLIDRQFRDPDLNPERAAGLLGISLRHLHLLFEHSEESFSQRLQRRRAEASRQALANPALCHRSVSDIAFESGFDNLATFYRVFRRCYGMTPSEQRAAAIQPDREDR